MRQDVINILLIDDNEDDYIITRDLLLDIEAQSFKLDWAATFDHGLAAILRQEHELYLVDYRLGMHDGVKLIQKAFERGCKAPMILLTGQDGREIDLGAMKVGAADYLIKGEIQPQMLDRSIRYALERARTLEALRESEERFRQLAGATFEGILIYDHQRIIDINNRFEEMFGYTSAEVLGRTITDFVAPESRELVTDRIEASCMTPYEFMALRRDGATFPVEANSRSTAYRDRNVTMVAIRDMTERKRMEEELINSRKLEAIGNLAGGIAHDFNNMLTAILGNISLAMLDTEPGSELHSLLTPAEHACYQARNLAHQLLTFARGGSPVKSIASLADLIEAATNFALSGSNVRCEFDLPSDLSPVEIDEGQITQVINNLVINAKEAMPDGGVIKIYSRNVNVTQAALAYRDSQSLFWPEQQSQPLPLKDGPYVEVIIRDHGVGIPKEYLGKIFDPYFTTKKQGNGLGLSTSYAIVKKHQGHLRVRSEVGSGAAFHFYLPAYQTQSTVKKPLTHPAPPGQGRILVMDDEQSIRELLAYALTRFGYQTELTKDGQEVVERYQQAQQTNHPFDVVIMDLTVPGGMGGKEAIQKLLEIDPNVKAIVSSGYSNEPVLSNYRQYGFSAVVSKPYEIQKLSKVIQAVLTEPTTQALDYS